MRYSVIPKTHQVGYERERERELKTVLKCIRKHEEIFICMFLLYFDTPTEFNAFLNIIIYQAAAYYYHGMILDEGNTEKSHGMAVAALQAAEEFLKESKKACEAFNLMPPLSR